MVRTKLLGWIVIFGAFFSIAADTPPPTFEGKVVSVPDGDIITVLDGNDIQHKVRLAGIDAPESHQDFGTASRQYLSRTVFHKTVTVNWVGTDQHRQTLGAVYLNDEFINLMMLKEGFAWYFKEHPELHTFAEAAEVAKDARRGLWIAPDPMAPWEFREMEAAFRKGTEEKPPVANPGPKTPSPQSPPIYGPSTSSPPSTDSGSHYGKVWVNGYTRKDGKRILGYWRSVPTKK